MTYIKFLLNQLKGWHSASYTLFGFAVGLQLMTLVSAPITTLSVITAASAILGVLCILAIGQAKAINGWLGLISAIGFIYVAFSAKNYLQISEQIVYMITLDIPVILNADWNKDMAGKIRHLTFKGIGLVIISGVLLWLISGYLISGLTDDPRPILDAGVFSVATLGGILAYMKYSEQYFLWSITGIVSLVLWVVTFKQGDASIAMLLSSMVYVLNDIIGFSVSPWFNKNARARLAQQEATQHLHN